MPLDARDPRPQLRDERPRPVGPMQSVTDPRDVGEDALERLPVQRNDGRRRIHRRGQLRDGHRADRAERLAEQDIGPRGRERRGVQVEGALAPLDRRADLRVDREAIATGCDRRARDPRKRTGGGWVVTVVRDRDEIVARSEGVRDLGAGGHEGHDPHPRRLAG